MTTGEIVALRRLRIEKLRGGNSQGGKPSSSCVCVLVVHDGEKDRRFVEPGIAPPKRERPRDDHISENLTRIHTLGEKTPTMASETKKAFRSEGEEDATWGHGSSLTLTGFDLGVGTEMSWGRHGVGEMSDLSSCKSTENKRGRRNCDSTLFAPHRFSLEGYVRAA